MRLRVFVCRQGLLLLVAASHYRVPRFHGEGIFFFKQKPGSAYEDAGPGEMAADHGSRLAGW